jgi:hypothetical protein
LRCALALDRAVALGAGLSEALGAIHAADLVHRDLKPSNTLMTNDGVRIIDFGIVGDDAAPKLTGTGQLLGTIGYLSPEQMRGEPATTASDVFAFGALMVYVTARHLPFAGSTLGAAAERMKSEPPDFTGVPEPLRPILTRCLDVTPSSRPRIADLLAHFGQMAKLPAPSPTSPTSPTALIWPEPSGSQSNENQQADTEASIYERSSRQGILTLLLAGVVVSPALALVVGLSDWSVVGPGDWKQWTGAAKFMSILLLSLVTIRSYLGRLIRRIPLIIDEFGIRQRVWVIGPEYSWHTITKAEAYSGVLTIDLIHLHSPGAYNLPQVRFDLSEYIDASEEAVRQSIKAHAVRPDCLLPPRPKPAVFTYARPRRPKYLAYALTALSGVITPWLLYTSRSTVTFTSPGPGPGIVRTSSDYTFLGCLFASVTIPLVCLFIYRCSYINKRNRTHPLTVSDVTLSVLGTSLMWGNISSVTISNRELRIRVSGRVKPFKVNLGNYVDATDQAVRDSVSRFYTGKLR